MKIVYKVVPYVVDDCGDRVPGSESFIARYQQYRTDISYALSIDDWTVASRAISEAEQIGLPTHLFYAFEIATEEIRSHPAFYFGLKITEDMVRDNTLQSRHLKKFNIVQDFSSEEIFLDERAKQVFDRYTRDTLLAPASARSDRPWYRITSMARLPEPVCIPKVMFLDENDVPPGTFIVQSDGRDVLSAASCEFVRHHGLVAAYRFRTPSAVLSWSPRILASGEFISRLQESHVNGVLTPFTPLLPDSHPLSGGRCA